MMRDVGVVYFPVTFIHDPSTLLLGELLGEYRDAWTYVARLWLWFGLIGREEFTARRGSANFPVVIANAAGFPGDADEFVAALVKAGFLDRSLSDDESFADIVLRFESTWGP